MRELIGQARFADARFAGDQEQPTSARQDIFKSLVQFFDFAVAADEGGPSARRSSDEPNRGLFVGIRRRSVVSAD